MDQNNHNQDGTVPHHSETFGKLPNPPERFGNVPNDSEPFRTVRKDSEGFRNVPNVLERKESHTLTVREAARMFEAGGVARTERSIVNWCQPNKLGIPRLENYFDPNERKYYLTPESVERAIQEEIQRSKKPSVSPVSAPVGNIRKEEEKPNPTGKLDAGQVKELERENFDLKISNRGKDYLIERMQDERNKFFEEVLAANRKVGELETKLLRLESPKPDHN
jgi:hypothetical protein